MALTQEQLAPLQQTVRSIINSLSKKEAYFLAQQIEPEIERLEGGDPALFKQTRELLFQLKWVGCQLITSDDDFLKLVREGFLEGLRLDANFGSDIVSLLTADRLALKFGVGTLKAIQDILSALRENNQLIGSALITIKGEPQTVRPSIRHWLVDFLRNTTGKIPSNMEESDYLFNNANAGALADNDRKNLGRVLAFYDNLRYVAAELAQTESRQTFVPPAESRSATGAAPLKELLQKKGIISRSLRQLAQENKEALNQILTGAPIRVADFDQPVKPTIKNWLVDYVKIKGAGHHEAAARNDYLLNSANAKNLAANERLLVAAILDAYDNDRPLPIDDSTKMIRLEGLTPPPKENIGSGAPPPAKKTFPPAPAPLTTPGAASPYREPILEKDLSGPEKPAPPPRPAPRLNGNVIDLKDLE